MENTVCELSEISLNYCISFNKGKLTRKFQDYYDRQFQVGL